MKVVWTMQAEARLVEIEEFISKDSSARAIAIVEKLIRRGEKLKDLPRSGHHLPEFHIENLREIIESSCRIVYRLLPHEVQILTVFEGHRLLRLDDVL